jgi:tRNA(fMet)-specific endonuclease VapC
MRFGEIGKKPSPKQPVLVREFLGRIDDIYPWDKSAVDATTDIKRYLSDMGTPIGGNDIAIAGHAIARGAVLVTNNTREFSRVPNLVYEDWAQ